MAPRARTESWTDTLTGCINDVVIMRPENPLEAIGRLLADSSARPNWKETAAAYAKRHDIHNRLAIGLDQAGINPREAPPKDVLALLSAALLAETGAAAADKKAAEKAAKLAAIKEAVGELVRVRVSPNPNPNPNPNPSPSPSPNPNPCRSSYVACSPPTRCA